ncbi:MAG: error-prone DNA polymerase [Candidatus Binatia bacterium]|nr:error-prone DNA polymerase [Candidatus Binatia bacterium]
MSDWGYVELRCRSAFSFLAGSSPPEDLIRRAAELGHGALALADRDGLYGAPRFWKAAKAAGTRPIVGAEVTLSSGRLLLLVESRTGYRNLSKLLTRGQARGEKGTSLVEPAELEQHAAGLICLAGAGESPLTNALRRGDSARATKLSGWLQGIFPSRVWVDVQRSLDPRVERRTRVLRDLADSVGIPLVASGDVRAARRSDRRVLDVLTCIGQKTTLDRAGRRLPINGEQHLVPPQVTAMRFRDFPGAIEATRTIAERCEFTLDGLGYRFPEFPVGPGETSQGMLARLTFDGARERYGHPLSSRVEEQLRHELAVIGKLELSGYFLIVWDIVRFCRDQGILVQGRGSAANSAVCYSLGITAVDAVGMELLFERFLSEERGEWPDIDLDLPSGDRREQVIQYVYRRYGPPEAIRRGPADINTAGSGVAMTANVITYRAKSALREAGKALGFAPLQLDRLSKHMAHIGFHDENDNLVSRLREGGVDVESPRVKLLVRCVESLQGLPRHLGQHSGGLVIAAGRLDEVVPLEPASMPGRTVVQWDKDDCADLGLIKIDLLGLGMMAVLEEALPLVREYEGIDLDLAKLPVDDPETYAMMRRADTVGVFQIESRAQMATLPRLKPKTFYDLVVEVAIIRPGPIVGQMVHPYLNRRSGREEIVYPHPRLEPILRRTLGVPLFQEQLLRVAMAVGGFSGGEAEELRRAMGFKRSVQLMQEIEQRLRTGLDENGIQGDAAEAIVRSITSFALYGFPESHAASFALIAYASAYLKAHHPAAFLCSLLNAWPMGFYHPSTLVKDAQQHGVRVLAIDVTCSNWESTMERGTKEGEGPAVRLGLRFVRGLREESARRLEASRNEAPFRDVADLVHRAELQQREGESLAELGALGGLADPSRRAALWQVAGLPKPSEKLLSGLPSPVSGAGPPPMTRLEETLADYRASGITTGPHVMAHLREDLDRRGIVPVADMALLADGSRATTAGLVIVRQRPMTAKGFCFLTLEDETGIGNAVITPSRYADLRRVLSAHPLVVLEGEIQRKDDVTHLRVDQMEPLGLDGPTPPSHDFR